MNKARECATVQACLAFLGQPSSALVECDRERPDALVRIDGDLVGVEVTTVVEAEPRQATAPQQWRAEVSRVVARAQAVAEASGREPVVAWLRFRPEWKPGTAPPAALADELVDTVFTALARPHALHEPVTLRDPHPALESLYVAHAAHGPYWTPTIASSVLPASAADIRATVSSKELELPAYQAVASRVWLLIDCDLTGQGIALDVPEPFGLTTGFERVFCCGFGMAQWIELRGFRRGL